DMGSPDKLGIFRQELERLGKKLLPPDINKSGVGFTVERDGKGDGAVRYALAAIKNVGKGAMEALVAERDANGPFKSLADFAKRVDGKVVNKRQLETLARAGAFDSINKNRAQVFGAVESMLKTANAAAQDRDSNQISLFGEAATPSAGLALPNTADWPPMD